LKIKKFIQNLQFEETGRGWKKEFIEYLLGTLQYNVIDTTGPFEINKKQFLSWYKKKFNNNEDEKQILNKLKEIETSIKFLNHKFNFELSLIKKEKIDDFEKIFYLAISHNLGLTSNFALKLQIILNEKSNLKLDGKIGTEIKKELLKSIYRDNTLSEEIKNVYKKEIASFENNNYRNYTNTNLYKYIIKNYTQNNSLILTKKEIEYLYDKKVSKGINFSLRILKNVFK
jgi:hypothetical protein